ncbi:amidohydrolase family protein [Gemmatimonadota bacterium]
MTWRLYLVLVLFGVLLCSFFFNCHSSTADNDFHLRLKAYIDRIKVIDTHEHLRMNEGVRADGVNFFTILNASYLKSDLISAGSPSLDQGMIAEGDLDKLWSVYGSWLDMTRNTSYYGHLVEGFRVLYGFDEPYFTRENIKPLSVKITQNYSDYDAWYRKSFQTANLELMFNDQYWSMFKTDLEFESYALVMRIDHYLYSISAPAAQEISNTDTLSNPFYQAAAQNVEIKTLDDYLGYAEKWFGRFADNGAVCAKTANAYWRTIYYEDIRKIEAEKLFILPADTRTPEQNRKLEDFMFHWCVDKCAEYDLPLQIHTGYLAGNGDRQDNGKPVKLLNTLSLHRQTRFSLFHGGFPWYQEIGALAKSFPNVAVDLVWLPQISRESAVDALHQWLDCVPYNKFFWGGDCGVIEGSVGALEFGKSVVAQVLAERVSRGLMTEELAMDVALKIFRDNAIAFFRLEEKLGRNFL